MECTFETAVVELERLTAEFKATTFSTEEDRQQALKTLKQTEYFKMIEKFMEK